MCRRFPRTSQVRAASDGKPPGATIAVALVQTGAVVAVAGFVVLILGEHLLFDEASHAAAIRSAKIAVVMTATVMVAKVWKRR